MAKVWQAAVECWDSPHFSGVNPPYFLPHSLFPLGVRFHLFHKQRISGGGREMGASDRVVRHLLTESGTTAKFWGCCSDRDIWGGVSYNESIMEDETAFMNELLLPFKDVHGLFLFFNQDHQVEEMSVQVSSRSWDHPEHEIQLVQHVKADMGPLT